MGNGLVAFLLAVGAAAWTYNRFMRTTGSLTTRSLAAAAVSGAVVFVVALIILSALF